MQMPARHARQTGSRGGGFKNYKPLSQEEQSAYGLIPKDFGQKVPVGGEEGGQLFHGSGLSHFCPKRFNRYPRFTIFFKKDKEAQAAAS